MKLKEYLALTVPVLAASVVISGYVTNLIVHNEVSSIEWTIQERINANDLIVAAVVVNKEIDEDTALKSYVYNGEVQPNRVELFTKIELHNKTYVGLNSPRVLPPRTQILYAELLAIKGIDEVFISPYNVSLMKYENFDWDEILPEVEQSWEKFKVN